MNPTSSHDTAKNLHALAQEATCLEALVRAGYPFAEATSWLDAWAGPEPGRLWLETAHQPDFLSSMAQRDIL